jgi:hypothetical protein
MNITKRIKWVFFTLPKNGADWAEQNEYRITYLVNLFLFIGIVSIIFTTIFSFLTK